MTHLHQAASGEFPVLLFVTIVLTAFVYLRGWFHLRSGTPSVIPAWRAGCFLLGLFLIWIAVASPIAALDHELLTVHMIKHLLLMALAAPLILLGCPFIALVRIPPRRLVRLGTMLAQPAFCWLAATVTLVVWHVPTLFTIGLQSEAWHAVQQASFLATGLLFWWPVVQPSSRWSIVLYLFLATLPCDILSGFLVFSERVAYPVYLATSQPSAVIADQQRAGALMWTSVTIIYLVAGAIISTRLLAAPQRNPQGMEVL